jgi:hypothetical protein
MFCSAGIAEPLYANHGVWGCGSCLLIPCRAVGSAAGGIREPEIDLYICLAVSPPPACPALPHKRRRSCLQVAARGLTASQRTPTGQQRATLCRSGSRRLPTRSARRPGRVCARKVIGARVHNAHPPAALTSPHLVGLGLRLCNVLAESGYVQHPAACADHFPGRVAGSASVENLQTTERMFDRPSNTSLCSRAPRSAAPLLH